MTKIFSFLLGLCFAALAGQSMGMVLQSPWGVLGVVTVLAVMMAGTFGAFDIRLPSGALGSAVIRNTTRHAVSLFVSGSENTQSTLKSSESAPFSRNPSGGWPSKSGPSSDPAKR